MTLKIVIPAAILSALIVGMFSIIFPKVEANEKPPCVLKHGDNPKEPQLAPKEALPALQKEANIVLNRDIPKQHPRFDSIVCGTTKYFNSLHYLIAVQGMLSRNGSMPKECSVRYFRVGAGGGSVRINSIIDCPPSPDFES